MRIEEQQLASWVRDTAEKLEVPGVAVGVYHAGEVRLASHGVTSIAHPLPVDARTLFQIASVEKTFTATAIMRLVGEGRVALDAPVRTYVPELQLGDEHAAAQVTVLQLLNHTSGFDGDVTFASGGGDDELAGFVAALAEAEQISRVGTAFSYNNAAFALANRVIERVTGETAEAALRRLVLDPVGLADARFFLQDVMTERFAVGHIRRADGSIVIARPWAAPRGGGISAHVADLLTWARFHLGDGSAADGTRVLSQALLEQMREPTFEVPAGDGIGIAWRLRDVEGVRLLHHGGSAVGQFTECFLAPGHDWAAVALSNSGPNGIAFNHRAVAWALDRCLGVADRSTTVAAHEPGELAAYLGSFESSSMTCEVEVDGGGLRLLVGVKPEVLAEAGEDDPAFPPMRADLLAQSGDAYRLADGPYEGIEGYFTRDAAGAVEGLNIGGRLFARVRS